MKWLKNILLLLLFCLGVFAGAVFFRFGYFINLKHHAQAIGSDASKYFHYLALEVENDYPHYKLKIKSKHKKNLKKLRNDYLYGWDHMLNGSQWHNRKLVKAKAKLIEGSDTSKVNLKLFGENNDHVVDPVFWSFRATTKQFNTRIGNTVFNLLRPNTRMYISDVLCNRVFKDLGLIYLNYKPINLAINKSKEDLYFIEDFYSKYIIERSNRREGHIFTNLKVNYPKANDLTEQDERRIDAVRVLEKTNPTKAFDLDKFYSFLALSFIAQNLHPAFEGNMHVYLNPVSNQLEPLIREVWFEHELYIKDQEDLKSQVKTYIGKTLVAANKDKKGLFDLIANDEANLARQVSRIIEINHLIQGILKEREWKAFEDVIYGRYPEALFLCRSLYHNNEQIAKLTKDQTQLDQTENKKQVLSGSTVLNKDLILNNTDLIIVSNTKVDLNGHKIVIRNGSLQADGSQGKIIISNSNELASSVAVLNATKRSYMINVDVSNISNIQDSIWKIPSALTFYESKVNIIDCHFSNNRRGDDFLNIFRCIDFNIENTVFKNILADAFDSDFSNGIVRNCTFINIGNDAVDGSGSEIIIKETVFKNIEDKAISAGELSKFKILNSIMINTEMALVAKDGSSIKERANLFKSNTLDYCIFNKKKEYDLGYLNTDKDISEYKHLIQTGVEIREYDIVALDAISKLANDIETIDDVKSLLYGNEFGKKTVK